MCSSACCVLVIANASSMKSFACALVICCGGCPCSSVLKTLPTVWCVRSHIALTCEFLLVVGTFLIRQPSNKSWNSGSINSPPLSWIQHAGHGYRVSQTCDISWRCELMFCHQSGLVRLSSKLCQSLLEYWTQKVYLKLGWSKVLLGRLHILWMALREFRAQARVHTLCRRVYFAGNDRNDICRSSIASLDDNIEC